nr:hypothetical protein [Tanacetum cinerariifolium]
MVKSEETNREHVDDIEKIKAKERQHVFNIREQAISKQADMLSKQAEMKSCLTRKDMWELQARMVKSEETNREHADDIEKTRAKERYVTRICGTSKQEWLKDMRDLQARMVKSEETNRQHADDIEKTRAKERQQVFTIREQAEAISKPVETLSKQADTLSKQAEMISFLTRK